MTNTFFPEVIEALAEARNAVKHMGTEAPEALSRVYTGYAYSLAQAFNALDNAGVFATLDEQTGYAAAEGILAEAASRSLDEAAGGPLDPAEWGDLSRTDIARRSASGPLG